MYIYMGLASSKLFRYCGEKYEGGEREIMQKSLRRRKLTACAVNGFNEYILLCSQVIISTLSFPISL